MEKPVLIDIHKKRNQRISEEMIEHATAVGKRDRVDLRPQAGFVFDLLQPNISNASHNRHCLAELVYRFATRHYTNVESRFILVHAVVLLRTP